MGRILKKKDPSKKKAQRLEKQQETAEGSSAEGASTSKAAVAQKKAATLVKQKPVSSEKNFFEKSIQFLREVKIELKKVTWPSRKQTMGSTVVVIILVMVISLFLGVVDFGLSNLIRAVLP